MLDPKLRKMFTKWRLYEKESVFWVILCYEQDYIVKMERYFRPDERRQLYNLIFDLFFEYEYDGKSLSARQIARLLWVHHSKIDTILLKARLQMKNEIQKQYSAKLENLTIL